MRERTYPTQQDEALRRAQAHRIPAILDAAADRLDRMNPATAMTERARFVDIQVSVWDHHGVYNDVAVGRDITATLIVVRDLPLAGTRAEYATRLRLAARAV
ncbi:hypothetical protein [Streptomyces sp. NPDC056707]|uniref:hypothetical protein n=1 Tax=Streptomyces sp. NPDC056707 TaxID=3345919 RepID=UPI0036CC8DFF